MGKSILFWVAVGATSVLGSCALAEEIGHSSLHYLSPDAVNVASALPGPPQDGSTDDQKDLAQVLALQASRSQDDCTRANSEADPSFESFFGAPYGPLTGDEVSQWSDFFARIQDDVNNFVKEEKNHWQRQRPFDAHTEVQPCLSLEKSYSYPSGHATIARVFADVLDQLDPTRKAIFDARADQIAGDRVLGGVHYPSDIAAGKVFGDQLFGDLQQIKKFEDDLSAAGPHSCPL